MATTTAMNKWAEELANSLIPTTIHPSKIRRIRTQFSRSIRTHNYARTNQFEVEERLTGLEEKFQVLNHDDLSDALRERRTELLEHQQVWVPDALDFLLRMSQRPMAARGMDVLNGVVDAEVVVPKLKWEDIEREDPINRKDRMWRQPEYSDFSSDEDLQADSAATSPESVKQRSSKAVEEGRPAPTWKKADTDSLESDLSKLRFGEGDASHCTVTELQIVREMLFMLQGMPTTLFTTVNGQLRRAPKATLIHMSAKALDSVLNRAINISKAPNVVRLWSFPGQRAPFVETLEDGLASIVRKFDSFVSEFHTNFIRAQHRGGVCSLLSVAEDVSQRASPVLTAAQFVRAAGNQDAVGLLDVLFELTCKGEETGQIEHFETLASILSQVLPVFTDSLRVWVETGSLESSDDFFFVDKVVDQTDRASLWHGWYTCNLQGPRRLPVFMASLAERVFVAGKTAAFIKMLNPSTRNSIADGSLEFLPGLTGISAGSTLQSFGQLLISGFEQYLDRQLSANTCVLQMALEQHCKLPEALSGLAHIYLSESPHATSVIENEIFSRLDRSKTSWNDRYMVSDIMEEAFARVDSVEMSRITILSVQLPTSQLQAERRSVKVLENLAIDYKLPWHIANIISTDCIASYRRISLLLIQIRRVKYVLERHGFMQLRQNAGPRTTAEAVYMHLNLFINVLHSHIMHCVIGPATARMRTQLRGTVDEMIAIHKSYTDAMERCCLLTKNLKMVRETLMSLLDLCMEFGFQITEKKNGIDDFALSKIKTQFRKLMNLFVAGLRGAARVGTGSRSATISETLYLHGNLGSDNTSELIDMLADSLESARFKM